MKVGFYSLSFQSVEKFLPRLVEKTWKNLYHRALVLTDSQEVSDRLSYSLWTYRQLSFLPHSTCEDPDPQLQPILLTHEKKNLNNATAFFWVGGGTLEDVSCAYLFCLFSPTLPREECNAKTMWHRFHGHERTLWKEKSLNSWEKSLDFNP